MVCLPAAFGFSALYLNSFTSKKLCTQIRIVYFGSKLFYAYSSTQNPCEIFCWCKKYHWGLILQIDENKFPLRQIRTVRNISGNRLFLWLFPSRRGAQGRWGWGLCKEWGKTVFLLCVCLWYMYVHVCVFPSENSTFPLIAQDLRRTFFGRWHETCFSSHLIMKEMVP